MQQRRNLLRTLAAPFLTPVAFAAPFPRAPFRERELPALIAVGNPGMFSVQARMDFLPPDMPRMGFGTSEINVRHLREFFHPVHLIDDDSLPTGSRLGPTEACDTACWKAVVSLLPRQKTWLIVGALAGETGAALLPMLTRHAVESGRQAHVFGIGPYAFEGENAIDAALATQQTVARQATDAAFLWNDEVWRRLGGEEVRMLDVFDVVDDACHAWIMGHCAVAEGGTGGFDVRCRNRNYPFQFSVNHKPRNLLKTLVALPLAGSVPVRPPPRQDALAVIGIGT